MLFTLTLSAQQFGGLPQYGVSLEGLVDNPSVINTSGKTVLAYHILLRDARGIGHGQAVILTRELRHGIVRQGPVPPNGIEPVGKNEGPIVSVTLDAVAFDTGEFVGPDIVGDFPVVAAVIDAERTLGEEVLQGKKSAADIEALSKDHKPLAGVSHEARLAHHAQVVLAQDLRVAKLTGDDKHMAEWCSKLPKLRRVQ
jgi:hypothetical protein